MRRIRDVQTDMIEMAIDFELGAEPSRMAVVEVLEEAAKRLRGDDK